MPGGTAFRRQRVIVPEAGNHRIGEAAGADYLVARALKPGMRGHSDVQHIFRLVLPRLYDEGAEETLAHLQRGLLVGVIPVCTRLLGPEAVSVALAGLDGVLGEAGNTVLGIGDIYAVQWMVTPASMSLLMRITLTRSPCLARNSGPGALPSNVQAWTLLPELSVIRVFCAVSVNRRSGTPGSSSRRSVTLMACPPGLCPCW